MIKKKYKTDLLIMLGFISVAFMLFIPILFALGLDSMIIVFSSMLSAFYLLFLLLWSVK